MWCPKDFLQMEVTRHLMRLLATRCQHPLGASNAPCAVNRVPRLRLFAPWKTHRFMPGHCSKRGCWGKTSRRCMKPWMCQGWSHGLFAGCCLGKCQGGLDGDGLTYLAAKVFNKDTTSFASLAIMSAPNISAVASTSIKIGPPNSTLTLGLPELSLSS